MVKTSIPASKKEKFYRESEGSAKKYFLYSSLIYLFASFMRETHTTYLYTPHKKKHDSRK